MKRKCKTPLERFERLYLKGEGDACWLWRGMVNHGGYGLFWVGPKNHDHERAHRKSWELYRGPIPQGMDLLHRCDVRRCVKPDHLFLGTQVDNMDDMFSKGRQAMGMALASKLDDAKVLAIMERRGEVQTVVAADFGVSQAMVGAIWLGRTWNHVTGLPLYRPKYGKRRPAGETAST